MQCLIHCCFTYTFVSPSLQIHPPDKWDVAIRLVCSAQLISSSACQSWTKAAVCCTVHSGLALLWGVQCATPLMPSVKVIFVGHGQMRGVRRRIFGQNLGDTGPTLRSVGYNTRCSVCTLTDHPVHQRMLLAISVQRIAATDWHCSVSWKEPQQCCVQPCAPCLPVLQAGSGGL